MTRDAESGLDNFGARYNASTMGRFMSPDPLGGKMICAFSGNWEPAPGMILSTVPENVTVNLKSSESSMEMMGFTCTPALP